MTLVTLFNKAAGSVHNVSMSSPVDGGMKIIIRMSPCRKASKKTETANYILSNRLHSDKLEIPSCDDPWTSYVWDFIPMASRRGDPTLIALVQQDRAWLRNTFEQLFVTSNDDDDDDDTVAPITTPSLQSLVGNRGFDTCDCGPGPTLQRSKFLFEWWRSRSDLTITSTIRTQLLRSTRNLFSTDNVSQLQGFFNEDVLVLREYEQVNKI